MIHSYNYQDDTVYWNAFDIIKSDWVKTNSICEGFNNGFDRLLSAWHISIHYFEVA